MQSIERMEEVEYIVSGDDMILETCSFITSVVRKGATMTLKYRVPLNTTILFSVGVGSLGPALCWARISCRFRVPLLSPESRWRLEMSACGLAHYLNSGPLIILHKLYPN